MQTQKEVGRQHQGMGRPGVWQVAEGSGEQGKMEKTGCKIICGTPTTLAVKGLIMMMIIQKCQQQQQQKSVTTLTKRQFVITPFFPSTLFVSSVYC